jgi:hypothetical protein
VQNNPINYLDPIGLVCAISKPDPFEEALKEMFNALERVTTFENIGVFVDIELFVDVIVYDEEADFLHTATIGPIPVNSYRAAGKEPTGSIPLRNNLFHRNGYFSKGNYHIFWRTRGHGQIGIGRGFDKDTQGGNQGIFPGGRGRAK